MKNKVGILQKVFAAVTLLFVFIFFSACGLYFFERGAQPKIFGSIPDALWYIIQIMTTIGYTDISPLTLGGKLICIVAEIVGILIGVACLFVIIIGTLRLGTFLRRTRVKKTNS